MTQREYQQIFDCLTAIQDSVKRIATTLAHMQITKEIEHLRNGSKIEPLATITGRYAEYAYQQCGYQKERTARELKVAQKTLYAILRRHRGLGKHDQV